MGIDSPDYSGRDGFVGQQNSLGKFISPTAGSGKAGRTLPSRPHGFSPLEAKGWIAADKLNFKFEF